MSWYVRAVLLLLAACGSPLSPDQLNEVVERQQGSLEECADSQTRELEVRIHVGVDGDVEDVRASGSPRAAACVERVIGTWSFPAAEAPVQASLPLTLRAEGSSEDS